MLLLASKNLIVLVAKSVRKASPVLPDPHLGMADSIEFTSVAGSMSSA